MIELDFYINDERQKEQFPNFELASVAVVTSCFVIRQRGSCSRLK